jgi:hypothetical protein
VNALPYGQRETTIVFSHFVADHHAGADFAVYFFDSISGYLLAPERSIPFSFSVITGSTRGNCLLTSLMRPELFNCPMAFWKTEVEQLFLILSVFVVKLIYARDL